MPLLCPFTCDPSPNIIQLTLSNLRPSVGFANGIFLYLTKYCPLCLNGNVYKLPSCTYYGTYVPCSPYTHPEYHAYSSGQRTLHNEPMYGLSRRNCRTCVNYPIPPIPQYVAYVLRVPKRGQAAPLPHHHRVLLLQHHLLLCLPVTFDALPYCPLILLLAWSHPSLPLPSVEQLLGRIWVGPDLGERHRLPPGV
jgi:hypothetical protein